MLLGYENRAAIAETCFALCDETGVYLFKGACTGSIADVPRGHQDFGWSPIFIPEGCEQTWGEMEFEQQASASMRRLAIEKLHAYLEVHYQ